jgi:hypothetical protein
VGVTTPNFGALVRFKIPMVPFYISTMVIVVYLARVKRALEQRNLKFDLREFRMGTGHIKDIVDVVRRKRKAPAPNKVGQPTGR